MKYKQTKIQQYIDIKEMKEEENKVKGKTIPLRIYFLQSFSLKIQFHWNGQASSQSFVFVLRKDIDFWFSLFT